MLKTVFLDLLRTYSLDKTIAEKLWTEIENRYGRPKRFYHTLDHLQNLYNELFEVKNEISDWDAVLFALYYHDIIYNSAGKDNEEKSAGLAQERLQSIGVPAEKISTCISLILATKAHEKSTEHDTNLFTDADLSILGQPPEIYSEYVKQVRKEYSIYPDFLYIPGRKKALKHFLDMSRIFKTNHFYRKYELQARGNLDSELKNQG